MYSVLSARARVQRATRDLWDPGAEAQEHEDAKDDVYDSYACRRRGGRR
jgi:hypothetical protein